MINGWFSGDGGLYLTVDNIEDMLPRSEGTGLKPGTTVLRTGATALNVIPRNALEMLRHFNIYTKKNQSASKSSSDPESAEPPGKRFLQADWVLYLLP